MFGKRRGESIDMISLDQIKMFPFSNVRFRADSK